MITRTRQLDYEECPATNSCVAAKLRECADLLESQEANPFRVRAYRNAATTIDALDYPISVALDEIGRRGLIRIPTIGVSISAAIEQICHSGHFTLLDRLRGEALAGRAYETLPGIGRELAARIHETLGIESLAQLENAAHDGSLERVPGMGRKRVRSIQDALAGRLQRQPRAFSPGSPEPSPPVDMVPVEDLLAIDERYRLLAEAGRLRRIAPRRFNPNNEAWLPIMHSDMHERHFTVLFSNTALAHELNRTNDWVVIFRDDHHGHGQWTVITARTGPMKGKRIVRGREPECQGYYDESENLKTVSA